MWLHRQCRCAARLDDQASADHCLKPFGGLLPSSEAAAAGGSPAGRRLQVLLHWSLQRYSEAIVQRVSTIAADGLPAAHWLQVWPSAWSCHSTSISCLLIQLSHRSCPSTQRALSATIRTHLVVVRHVAGASCQVQHAHRAGIHLSHAGTVQHHHLHTSNSCKAFGSNLSVALQRAGCQVPHAYGAGLQPSHSGTVRHHHLL